MFKSALITYLLVASVAINVFAISTSKRDLPKDTSGSRYKYKNGKAASSNISTTGHGWPQCSPGSQQWSGYLNINSTINKNYFYWAFGPRTVNPHAPVVLWMTGGPGCSSSLALLVENGPCHIDMTTGSLVDNPYGWNSDAYTIYIDQPAGVGFSYADFPDGWDHDEDQVSEDMYWFMQEWYKAHPELLRNDLFVIGESYAGHYAPATAHRILKRNNQGVRPKLPLKGLGVGNGLVQPEIQYQYYGKMATMGCTEKIGHPCLGASVISEMNASLPGCISAIRKCQQYQKECFVAYMVCNVGQMIPFKLSGLNLYDIRKPCIGLMCYDFSKVVNFMNRADVQMALGVRGRIPVLWQDCNHEVTPMFINDWMHTFDMYVADLLNSDHIRVMIYAGDLDYICNWLGNQAWTLSLNWEKKAVFNAAPVKNYYLDNRLAATVRSVSSQKFPNQFSFIKVLNAGHMVPMDQPAVASSILKKFLSNQKWD